MPFLLMRILLLSSDTFFVLSLYVAIIIIIKQATSHEGRSVKIKFQCDDDSKEVADSANLISGYI